MGSVNKVMLLGNLGQDPELRSTTGGKQVATLNLATSESWVRDGKREERTEWHRLVLWDKLAENASKYLKKGSSIFVEGRLQTRSWDDANGVKKYTTEVLVSTMTFIGKAPEGGSSKPAASTSQAYGSDFADEDVPF